ncbi:uncharacterized protein B0H18DRAFT_1002465, partial [Fomitopsis serialis]|uniref:uncharacterized protein n=1 Tax=Fomitopsis serialis TaxID=139415 RepID=UPI002008BBD9
MSGASSYAVKTPSSSTASPLLTVHGEVNTRNDDVVDALRSTSTSSSTSLSASASTTSGTRTRKDFTSLAGRVNEKDPSLRKADLDVSASSCYTSDTGRTYEESTSRVFKSISTDETTGIGDATIDVLISSSTGSSTSIAASTSTTCTLGTVNQDEQEDVNKDSASIAGRADDEDRCKHEAPSIVLQSELSPDARTTKVSASSTSRLDGEELLKRKLDLNAPTSSRYVSDTISCVRTPSTSTSTGRVVEQPTRHSTPKLLDVLTSSYSITKPTSTTFRLDTSRPPQHRGDTHPAINADRRTHRDVTVRVRNVHSSTAGAFQPSNVLRTLGTSSSSWLDCTSPGVLCEVPGLLPPTVAPLHGAMVTSSVTIIHAGVKIKTEEGEGTGTGTVFETQDSETRDSPLPVSSPPPRLVPPPPVLLPPPLPPSSPLCSTTSSMLVVIADRSNNNMSDVPESASNMSVATTMVSDTVEVRVRMVNGYVITSARDRARLTCPSRPPWLARRVHRASRSVYTSSP